MRYVLKQSRLYRIRLVNGMMPPSKSYTNRFHKLVLKLKNFVLKLESFFSNIERGKYSNWQKNTQHV
jgi:hypothetical protein